MKKLSFLAVLASFVLYSCGGATGDKATTGAAEQVAEQSGATYTVDSSSSKLKWKGYHKGGFDPRFGTLATTGTVSVENGTLTAGSFIIDIKSIVTDAASVDTLKTGGKTSLDLDNHLKTADFFDAETYPTAKFEITSVVDFDAANDVSVVEGATHIISGNLTIKDQTVNVTFPAKTTIADDAVTVASKFTINRQDWGLTYGTEGDPKDWMISQEVDIELNIKANK